MVRHEHGTRARYAAGCRCRRCKEAWASYIRGRRHARNPDRETSLRQIDVRRTRAVVSRAVEQETDPELPVKFSPLGGQILVAIQERRGLTRGEVLDELLREHGAEM